MTITIIVFTAIYIISQHLLMRILTFNDELHRAILEMAMDDDKVRCPYFGYCLASFMMDTWRYRLRLTHLLKFWKGARSLRAELEKLSNKAFKDLESTYLPPIAQILKEAEKAV